MSTDDQNTLNTELSSGPENIRKEKFYRKPAPRHAVMAISAIALLLIGAMAGAKALGVMHPPAEMAPAIPISISAMPDWGLVTVKGQVAEIFGNKFVVQDGTGRVLVETGRAGEGGKLVAKDEAITVQGRFEHGFIHASFVVHADGRVEALHGPGGPGGPPRPGLHGWLHRLVGESERNVSPLALEHLSAAK